MLEVGFEQVPFQIFEPKVCLVLFFICPRALEQDLFFLFSRLVSRTKLFQVLVEYTVDADVL